MTNESQKKKRAGEAKMIELIKTLKEVSILCWRSQRRCQHNLHFVVIAILRRAPNALLKILKD